MKGWNEDAIKAVQARVSAGKSQTVKNVKRLSRATETPMQRMQALGHLPAGKMNKSEAEYSRHLENRKHAGEIIWWAFEPLKIRLADNTFYTPDFGVLLSNNQFEFHEYKGFWVEDSRVKIKIAAEILPFQFIAITKEKGQYKFEYF